MYPRSLEAITALVDQGWRATVTVMVADDEGNPVAEATVLGFWKNGTGEESCTTNGNGQCDLTSDLLEKKDVTFTIEEMTHASATFNSNRNLDPEGNPYGRSIKIKKPKDDEVQSEALISEEPTATEEPTVEPTPAPMEESTAETAEEPTAEPTPTEEPTAEPTLESTID
jgi:hypothetical protein